jgi:hypothetical protein
MFYFNIRSLRNGARLRALKRGRRLSMSCVVFAAALTGSVSAAHAVECLSEKGAGYPWAWREIDGKRCWYKGKPGMDKKLLRWAESTSASAASKASATPKASAAPKRSATPNRSRSVVNEDPAEREHLLHSYWPPLPPADVFNDRFDAARAKRL